MTHTLLKPGKSQYTENEVAEELGVSVEHLRSLIRERVMPGDDDVRQTSILSFQPSDLLLLRLLASQCSPSSQG
jgi:DNA-binding transcriptional MerR regulator